VDEALTGERVSISRHGKVVVQLTPTQPVRGKPMDKEMLDWLAKCREGLPALHDTTWADIIREMRDED
jgi:antitoxin (DNA-binding transcriptional repressor) of toxin-antitoxin stability system